MRIFKLKSLPLLPRNEGGTLADLIFCILLLFFACSEYYVLTSEKWHRGALRRFIYLSWRFLKIKTKILQNFFKIHKKSSKFSQKFW